MPYQFTDIDIVFCDGVIGEYCMLKLLAKRPEDIRGATIKEK